jgi:REP element-mobilizing transposase RayT
LELFDKPTDCSTGANFPAVASGYPHHITQRGARSIPIFQADGDRRSYLGFVAEELNHLGVDVLASCLMTNHTHLIVVPKG